jgi:recombination protein RecT
MNGTEIQKAANSSLQKQDVKITTLQTVKALLNSDNIKKRFEEILGKKTPGFTASITSLVSGSTNFSDVEPNSIVASAFIAATLDLPINSNLGFAYILPYNDNKRGKVAQFQMGYKGFIQLALRTGQYKLLNAVEIYEGELVEHNKLTGVIVIDQDKRTSNKIIGYASYFRLINGFEKYLYMATTEIDEHAKKYSKSYNSEYGLWKKNFHVMGLKTVLKLLLSKYGILSIEMRTAIEADQATALLQEGEVVYDYTDATEDDSESFSNYENPAYILQKIYEITNPIELGAWESKHKKDIDAIGGKEGEEIQAAIEAKKVSFNQAADPKKKK